MASLRELGKGIFQALDFAILAVVGLADLTVVLQAWNRCRSHLLTPVSGPLIDWLKEQTDLSNLCLTQGQEELLVTP